jgi:SNF2 family DNA or RNA helicase
MDNLDYFSNHTKVFESELSLKKRISDRDIRFVHSPPTHLLSFGSKLHVIDIKDIPENVQTLDHVTFRNVPTTPYHTNWAHPIHPKSKDWLVYPYIDMRSIEEMKSERILSIKERNFLIVDKPKWHNATVLVRLEKQSNNNYCVSYYINNNVIENVRHNKRDFRVSFLQNFLISDLRGKSIYNALQALRTIQNTTAPSSPPSEVDIQMTGFKLFNYQKADISWMQKIEQDVVSEQNVLKIEHPLLYPMLDGKCVLYNTSNALHIGAPDESLQCIKHTFPMRYFGGNLISDTGLGKTVVVLVHILKDTTPSATVSFVEKLDTCIYSYKRGTKRGQFCSKASESQQLYCKQHTNTPFIEKKPFKLVNLDSFNINDFITPTNKLKTHATLVITPSQLCDQWIKEYYEKFAGPNEHRIVMVATADQLKNLSLADLLFADIVVVSYNLILTAKFQSMLASPPDFRTEYITSKSKDEFLLQKGDIVSLSNFHWRRVVCDESHEILSSTKPKTLLNTIKSFKSTFKWNISSTPFSHGIKSFLSQILLYTDFDRVETTFSASGMSTGDFLSTGLNGNLIQNCAHLYRRNTKESIKEEVPTNTIREHIHLLNFTEQERTIYNSHFQGTRNKYSDFLRKLCCHTELFQHTRELVKKCKTLGEIQDVMLRYNKECMTNEERKTAELEARINSLLQSLLDVNTEEEREQIKQIIGACKRSLIKSKKSYDEIKRTYTYLQNAIENLKAQDSCPICLEEFGDNDDIEIVVTPCGHKFCWPCISQLHKQVSSLNFKCPNCKSPMSKEDIYVVSDNKSEINNKSKPSSDIKSLIERTKSTKMASIIHFIKTATTADDKIILFSQWEELLSKICTFLQEYNIPYVNCHGNVYQRTSAIRKFKYDPSVRVILLSSNNAASGINLTVANKIIMLEPVYGPLQYRQSIEAQSVGRADRITQSRPIDIYRFIIKDTIEEDIVYNRVDDTKMQRY